MVRASITKRHPLGRGPATAEKSECIADTERQSYCRRASPDSGVCLDHAALQIWKASALEVELVGLGVCVLLGAAVVGLSVVLEELAGVVGLDAVDVAVLAVLAGVVDVGSTQAA